MSNQNISISNRGRSLIAILMAVATFSAVPRARAADVEATTAPRSQQQILTDFKAIEMPQPDREKFSSDPAYRGTFMKQYFAAQQARQKLAHEYLESYPDDQEAAMMIQVAWLLAPPADWPKTENEIDEFIKKCKTPANVGMAKYARTVLVTRSSADNQAKLAAINQFVADVPTMKEQGANLLFQYAQTLPAKDAKAIYQQIKKSYPDTSAAAEVFGAEKLADAEGKPFDLKFTDAISGKKISTDDLKGKVIVVDFWATWCGPCVGEMPNMKKLYAEYKDKGVQFIGVSLDQPEAQGGLKALKDFVAQNDIGWPQYYQGKGWESDFSKSWGIMSIPHVFVVDKQGKVVTTDGRGQLETLLPRLLQG